MSSTGGLESKGGDGVVAMWSIERVPGVPGTLSRGSFVPQPTVHFSAFARRCTDVCFAVSALIEGDMCKKAPFLLYL